MTVRDFLFAVFLAWVLGSGLYLEKVPGGPSGSCAVYHISFAGELAPSSRSLPRLYGVRFVLTNKLQNPVQVRAVWSFSFYYMLNIEVCRVL